MSLAPLLILPILGALAVILAPARRAKWIALAVSTITFFYSLVLAFAFDHWQDGGFAFATAAPLGWLDEFGITFGMGADSVSMFLVLLTTLIMPLCVWGSFTGITERIKEYFAWMLAIEAAMIGVFVARDLIFFYICFEFTLVPMYVSSPPPKMHTGQPDEENSDTSIESRSNAMSLSFVSVHVAGTVPEANAADPVKRASAEPKTVKDPALALLVIVKPPSLYAAQILEFINKVEASQPEAAQVGD